LLSATPATLDDSRFLALLLCVVGVGENVSSRHCPPRLDPVELRHWVGGRADEDKEGLGKAVGRWGWSSTAAVMVSVGVVLVVVSGVVVGAAAVVVAVEMLPLGATVAVAVAVAAGVAAAGAGVVPLAGAVPKGRCAVAGAVCGGREHREKEEKRDCAGGVAAMPSLTPGAAAAAEGRERRANGAANVSVVGLAECACGGTGVKGELVHVSLGREPMTIACPGLQASSVPVSRSSVRESILQPPGVAITMRHDVAGRTFQSSTSPCFLRVSLEAMEAGAVCVCVWGAVATEEALRTAHARCTP